MDVLDQSEREMGTFSLTAFLHYGHPCTMQSNKSRSSSGFDLFNIHFFRFLTPNTDKTLTALPPPFPQRSQLKRKDNKISFFISSSSSHHFFLLMLLFSQITFSSVPPRESLDLGERLHCSDMTCDDLSSFARVYDLHISCRR